MTFRKILPVLVFLALAGAVVTGLRLTRDAVPAVAKGPVAKKDPYVVDLAPIRTARRMARLAASQDEKRMAHDAERLADHEVDLAFADALRQAAYATPPATPEVRALLAAKTRQEDAVDDGQRNLARLGKSLAAASEQAKDAIEDQIEVAKAQLELDKDELDATDAMLEKLGADPGARIKRLKATFTSGEQIAAEEDAEGPVKFQPGSLLHRLAIWQRLRGKLASLDAARDEAIAKGEDIGARQQELAREVEQEKEDRESARAQAKGFARGAKGAAEAAGTSRETARATLMTLRYFTENQRTLADLGKRYQDQKDLAEVYRTWRAAVAGEERAALHAVMQRAAWILVVMSIVWFADWIFEMVFRAMLAGRKRIGRNLKVVKFSAQALGLLAIVLLVLGTPGQLTTLLGLAGAGLTVALKDFIISFFGWFILVGPKGIHVGDWVEIKGVAGEVVEIGLLRTLILETGSWSDAGHPTGRVVSFVNSFALEGHFFNFSSSGQWMWDELVVTAPAGEDPHPFVESIKSLVEARTADNAAKAFKEWEQSERGYRIQGLKNEPGITMVPTGGGVEIRVRYITKVEDRNELRRDLNQAVVDLLHAKRD